MFADFPEVDWKLFRKLSPVALERFCQRVLDEAAEFASQAARGSHERYLDLYRLIKKRDKELAEAFDDQRRSRALVQLLSMRRQGLLTDQEFSGFTQETREIVERFLGSNG